MINSGGRDNDGHEVFMIGLSDEDLERLQDGQTMTLRMAGYPPDVVVMIYSGSTDKAMADKLVQDNPELEVRTAIGGTRH